MKKILAFLALGLLLGACSGKLSSSKAEKLIQEELKKNPIQGEESIKIGDEVEFIGHYGEKDGTIDLYEKLKDEGMIEMTFLKKNESWGNYYYSIHLTDKGKKYLSKEEKNKNSRYPLVKTYSAALHKIEEIHLIPERNSAEVLVSFKLEKTPFFILQGKYQNDDIISNWLYFKKLEEKGWAVGYVGLD